jgi:hypothetical protein
MPDAVSPTTKESLVDRIRPPRFTCVHGQVQQVVSGEVEGRQVVFRGVAGLASGQIESDDAPPEEIDCQLGKSERSALQPVSKAANDNACTDVGILLG